MKSTRDSFIVRRGKPADWEAILKLTAESFSVESNKFVRQWSHSYFGPEAARNFVVCESYKRIIGVINQVPLSIRLGNARLRVAGLCGVCTKPEERGKGVMVAMMATSLQQQQRHVPAAILWGGRDLYRPFGFETAGRSYYVTINRRMVSTNPGLPLRRLTPLDAASLLRLASRVPGGVIRSLSWQEQLLKSERTEAYGNAHGELSTYVVYVAEEPLLGRVVEAIGQPEDLAGLLRGFLEEHNLEQVRTWFPPGIPLGKAMALRTEETFAAGVEDLCATNLSILDFPELLHCLSQPLASSFQRCKGVRTLKVKCEPDQRTWHLRVNGDHLGIRETAAGSRPDLTLDRTRWVRLLFPPPGSDLMDSDLEPGLRDAFRLQLVYPPWDIV